jgi:hypothetical protein
VDRARGYDRFVTIRDDSTAIAYTTNTSVTVPASAP